MGQFPASRKYWWPFNCHPNISVCLLLLPTRSIALAALLDFLAEERDLLLNVAESRRPGAQLELEDRGIGVVPEFLMDLGFSLIFRARSARRAQSRATCFHSEIASSQRFCFWRISANAAWLSASATSISTIEV